MAWAGRLVMPHGLGRTERPGATKGTDTQRSRACRSQQEKPIATATRVGMSLDNITSQLIQYRYFSSSAITRFVLPAWLLSAVAG